MNTIAHTTDPVSRPHTDPWDSGWLDVGDGHRIYFEQCGNPTGVPVVLLHGGPGSGCGARHRQLLDADGYRMVMFD
jgi:proline iminopeptidase